MMDDKSSPFNHPQTILWGTGAKNYESIPNIIWVFWDSDKKHTMVEICLKKIKSTLSDFEINIIDHKTLNDFLPNAYIKRDDLPIANFSDLIRLDLLRNYGGFWIDASTLLTENLDWIIKLKSESNPDTIGFFSDFFSNDLTNPILENWFLASPKNSRFIEDWYQEYKTCYLSKKPQEFYKEITGNTAYMQKIDYGLASYILPYISAIKIMRTNNDYRILMISANDTAHYYNFALGLSPHHLAQMFLLNKAPEELPKLIKFEKRGRNAIEEYIKRGQYSRKSLLFQIVKQKQYYITKLPKLLNYAFYILNNLKRKYLA